MASMESMPGSPRHLLHTSPVPSDADRDDEEATSGPAEASVTSGATRKGGARTTLLIPIRAGFDGEMPFMGNAAPNAVLHPYSGEG